MSVFDAVSVSYQHALHGRLSFVVFFISKWRDCSLICSFSISSNFIQLRVMIELLSSKLFNYDKTKLAALARTRGTGQVSNSRISSKIVDYRNYLSV